MSDDIELVPRTFHVGSLQISTEYDEIILQPRPSDDPNDPLNWHPYEKYWNFSCAAFYTLMVFTLIDVATPTWGPMNIELGFSYDVLRKSYAVACGSLAVGALLFIPFALKFGRRPIYILSIAALLAISIWSAEITSVVDLILVNALGFLVASLSEVLVQLTVADVFFIHQRGRMNTAYIWITYLGGNLGPLIAGYVTDSQGWRWTWRWCAIFFGITLIVFTFGYEETKFNRTVAMSDTPTASSANSESQALIDESASDSGSLQWNRWETEDTIRRRMHIDYSIPRKSYRERLSMTTTSPGALEVFFRHSYQPIIILFTIPAVGYMSLAYGMMLAWQTVMTVTLSSQMLGPPWNFSASQIGLMSLSTFVGSTIGSLICVLLSDRIILWLSCRNNGVFEPEMRLWIMIPLAPLLPIGALIFGHGLNNGWSWQIIAGARIVACVGSAPISIISITYIMDSYSEIVGDALVGLTFTRNVLSTIFVFVLSPWIAQVGIENVYITIGLSLEGQAIPDLDCGSIRVACIETIRCEENRGLSFSSAPGF
ncbi:major facilitator superfamily domain-containing protein [Lophiotrema nucula]|uniref:Major facilitator superfamily domain-containing protein n=1 Tax=Lophiotrema nucula TaxID=690887 RepID=A0A6A5YHX5_9PLEO|nr:major facilitator superfamily domain-containing protein [Lophiotrema nucula]